MWLLSVATLHSGVLTNCAEPDLRQLLREGGLVTVACDGTITLSNTLNITTNVYLDTTGHQLILSGGDRVRVLYVAPTATNQFGLDGTLVFHDEPSQTGRRFYRVAIP